MFFIVGMLYKAWAQHPGPNIFTSQFCIPVPDVENLPSGLCPKSDSIFSLCPPWRLYYTPNNASTEEIMTSVQDNLPGQISGELFSTL